MSPHPNKDQLYIADQDGRNVTHISSDSTHNYYPSWLPDGETIIYGMKSGLWKMNIKKTAEKKPLIPGTGYAEYALDGKKIAFKKGNWPSAEIWLCDSDGSNPVQLTDAQKMKGLFIGG
ncbi:TolB family protein [Mucilaginibacter sp. McL0603]|uniref:TolB family protein n=1 Tax=Mucilaginibacter sp. McL0603 TaxID=3415670 RepID=UPI003CE7C7AD